MNKLKIFVCEKFYMEYQKILDDEGVVDAVIVPYPCISENKSKKNELWNGIKESDEDIDQGILFCSKYCEALDGIPEGEALETHLFDYCFNYLAEESVITHFLERGGFIFGLGWLKNWKQHIPDEGLEQKAAKKFYQETFKKLVFFDAGIDGKAEKDLVEVSEFLEIPYIIVPIELKTLQLVLLNSVYKWKLQNTGGDGNGDKKIKEVQGQCAEYSAIIELMGKIASFTNKREAIEKIIDLYQLTFGAHQVKYWGCDMDAERIPEEIHGFFACVNNHLFFQEQNRFCVKIHWNDKLYGVLDVGSFTAPQNIVRYLSFAVEIAKICGVVFSNIEQYEQILKSHKELKYATLHDPLTGLYNRGYLNVLLEREPDDYEMTVFVFDIDKMKSINDTFGHAEGDKLIKKVADALKGSLRETDYLIRIGGDEFIAILPQSDQRTAETVRKRIEEEVASQNSSEVLPHLKIRISMGFATTDEETDTLGELMHLADSRMYEEQQRKQSMQL